MVKNQCITDTKLIILEKQNKITNLKTGKIKMKKMFKIQNEKCRVIIDLNEVKFMEVVPKEIAKKESEQGIFKGVVIGYAFGKDSYLLTNEEVDCLETELMSLNSEVK